MTQENKNAFLRSVPIPMLTQLVDVDKVSRDKKPSPELFEMIQAAASSLTGFAQLWESIRKKGNSEGFNDEQLQRLLRPLLQNKLGMNRNQVYYLFHKEELKEKQHHPLLNIQQIAGKNVLLNDEKTFQKNRLQALARDNNQCTMCGTTEDLQIHHKKHDVGIGIDHSLDNLQTLCRRCHSIVTRSNSADSPNRPHAKEPEQSPPPPKEPELRAPENPPEGIKYIEEEDPRDVEIQFLKEENAQLKEAMHKVQHFQPANAFTEEDKETILVGPKEDYFWNWLKERADGVHSFWYDAYGIDLFRNRELAQLKNSGVKVFRRLYFEV